MVYALWTKYIVTALLAGFTPDELIECLTYILHAMLLSLIPSRVHAFGHIRVVIHFNEGIVLSLDENVKSAKV